MSADEMFKKLRYKKYFNDENEVITYAFEGSDYIKFYNKRKLVKAYIWQPENDMPKYLNTKELQAINEKVKELGWNE